MFVPLFILFLILPYAYRLVYGFIIFYEIHIEHMRNSLKRKSSSHIRMILKPFFYEFFLFAYIFISNGAACLFHRFETFFVRRNGSYYFSYLSPILFDIFGIYRIGYSVGSVELSDVGSEFAVNFVNFIPVVYLFFRFYLFEFRKLFI